MKQNMMKSVLALFATTLLLAATSCENGDIEFADYKYQTVYFANQTPIRTITLGTDEHPNELDNQHKFKLFATCGGVWTNKQDRKLEIAVDNSLCDGITFEDGSPVVPLPQEYYTLASHTITIPAGQLMGGVEVQLTDAFFADPKATGVHYVLPVRIVGCQDSILVGKAKPTSPNPYRLNAADWDVVPHDYVLYALKYKNKYHGAWLSHGTDEIDLNGVVTTVVRGNQYREKDETRYLRTVGLDKSTYELSTQVDVDTTKYDDKAKKMVTVREKKTLKCTLELTFDASDNCTVRVATLGCEGSGTGKWEFEGAKKAWNNADHDQITLDYTVTYHYTDDGRPRYKTFKSKDVLVMKTRENRREDFAYKLK